MALFNRFTRMAIAACGAVSLCINVTSATSNEEPDPWFTKEHKHPIEEEKEKKKQIPGIPQEEEETVTLKRTNPSTLVKRIRKELQSVPETNLGKRIALLEQIVNTDRPKESDIADLRDASQLRRSALSAISEASDLSLTLSESITVLSPFARYYLGDSDLLVALLKSEFSNRLDREVASLSRRNQSTQLSSLKDQMDRAGLNRVFGKRIQSSAGDAASSMIARRWAELLDETSPLPGEAFLVSQLLGHSIGKLSLAITLPASADPRLSNSIARGLETTWGDNFRLSPSDAREVRPEFVLSIGVQSIQSSHTVSEKQVESTIPGAVEEEPNPDFLKLVKRYEKAAENYEFALENYEMMYDDYIEGMNDDEYRQAQQDLSRAQETLAATPFPAGNDPEGMQAYNAAVQMRDEAEMMANSISTPTAIEPVPPYPHHLKILEDLHLVPSTIIISAEETPYEYTEKTLDFLFEASAPMSLNLPPSEGISVQTQVSLGQNRNWVANEGVHPRDPSATSGTYSESEYQSALDIFGLEFATTCAQELETLFTSVKEELKSKIDRNSLEDSLLLLSLTAATGDSEKLKVNEQELNQLAELAMNPDTGARDFRSTCLSILLSKTEFSHLADRNQIEQRL